MENSPRIEQMPENSNQDEKIPSQKEKTEIKKEKEEKPEKKEDGESEQQTPAAKAKARGRPKGSTDKKARIKRIPITPPEEEEIAKPKVKAKKAVVLPIVEELDSSIEEEQVPMMEQESLVQESGVQLTAEIPEPQPAKSPRTLQREHMQEIAAQKRAIAQARQDRFERVLDRFMGF